MKPGTSNVADMCDFARAFPTRPSGYYLAAVETLGNVSVYALYATQGDPCIGMPCRKSKWPMLSTVQTAWQDLEMRLCLL